MIIPHSLDREFEPSGYCFGTKLFGMEGIVSLCGTDVGRHWMGVNSPYTMDEHLNKQILRH